MGEIGEFWGVLFWVALVLGALYLGPLQARRAPGRVTQVATWILMTLVTLAYGGLAIFVVVHVLLFTLGTGAAFFGLAVSGLLIVATPVLWWFGVRAAARWIEPNSRAGSGAQPRPRG